MTCIKIKTLRNEDAEEFEAEMDIGGTHKYAVNALDDIRSSGFKLAFPEELKKR